MLVAASVLTIILTIYAIVSVPALQLVAVLLAMVMLVTWVAKPPQPDRENGWLGLLFAFLVGRWSQR